MRTAETKQKLEEALDFLNATEKRATYGAVGEYIGVHSRSVSQLLGEPSLRASWVVAASGNTKGYPSEYAREDIHPKLTRSSLIVKSGDALARGIAAWRSSQA